MDSITQLYNQLNTHPYVRMEILIVLTFVAAMVAAWLIERVVLRLVHKTPYKLDDIVIRSLHRPIFLTILIYGLTFAFESVDLSVERAAFLRPLCSSLVLIIWTFGLIKLSRQSLPVITQSNRHWKFINHKTQPLIQNLLIFVLFVCLVFYVLRVWGIDMTGWAASAGVAGIAIGFAAKDTLANFISGVVILTDMPYRIGDYVVLDTGERGAITHIGLRSTRMLTRDDVELTIPNSIMCNSKIVNESGGPHKKFRIRIPITVAYGSDLDSVINMLSTVADNNKLVCPYPERRVRFRELGSSGLEFELLCWVNEPKLRGQVIDELLHEIYLGMLREKIEIPYTKRDIHIKSIPDNMNLDSTKQP